MSQLLIRTLDKNNNVNCSYVNSVKIYANKIHFISDIKNYDYFYDDFKTIEITKDNRGSILMTIHKLNETIEQIALDIAWIDHMHGNNLYIQNPMQDDGKGSFINLKDTTLSFIEIIPSLNHHKSISLNN